MRHGIADAGVTPERIAALAALLSSLSDRIAQGEGLDLEEIGDLIGDAIAEAA